MNIRIGHQRAEGFKVLAEDVAEKVGRFTGPFALLITFGAILLIIQPLLFLAPLPGLKPALLLALLPLLRGIPNLALFTDFGFGLACVGEFRRPRLPCLLFLALLALCVEAVKTLLRPIATEVGVDLFNSKGGRKNTQQLGADVIRALNARNAPR